MEMGKEIICGIDLATSDSISGTMATTTTISNTYCASGTSLNYNPTIKNGTSCTDSGIWVTANPCEKVVLEAIKKRPSSATTFVSFTPVPKIKDYAIYNGRAIKVIFEDDTFTKCVAESEDEFDFFTGLAFCLFKKMLGKDGHKRFNAMMRKAIKECDKVDERHDQEKAEEERRKAKQRKAELKRAVKAAKARQEQIDMQSAAVIDALRKFGKEI